MPPPCPRCQALLANCAASFAIYHGPDGVRGIAEKVHHQASVTAEALRKLGHGVNGTFFDTLSVSLKGSFVVATNWLVWLAWVGGCYVQQAESVLRWTCRRQQGVGVGVGACRLRAVPPWSIHCPVLRWLRCRV